MSFASVLQAALAGSVSTILLGLAGLWAHRRLRGAQAKDTDASAQERLANVRARDTETWNLMNGTLERNVGRLDTEVTNLQNEVETLHTELDGFRGKLRLAVSHITDVHLWDAHGRVGDMPSIPPGLTDSPV
jgi:hypothetical protein